MKPNQVQDKTAVVALKQQLRKNNYLLPVRINSHTLFFLLICINIWVCCIVVEGTNSVTRRAR